MLGITECPLEEKGKTAMRWMQEVTSNTGRTLVELKQSSWGKVMYEFKGVVREFYVTNNDYNDYETELRQHSRYNSGSRVLLSA